MPNVVIDGVEYVPKVVIKPLHEGSLHECLMVLTEMIYFNQSHKMFGLAYEAIQALSPELADLEPNEAYSLIHGRV